MAHYGHHTYKALKDLLEYDFTKINPKAAPRYSLIEVDGIYRNGEFLGNRYYYFPLAGTYYLTGILMYRNGSGLKRQNYNFDELEHECGIALYFSQVGGGFLCVDITEATSVADVIETVLNNRINSTGYEFDQIGNALQSTFSAEDLKRLADKFDAINFPDENLSDAKKAFVALEDCKDRQEIKKKWIEKGYPCSERYGFAYRGAVAKRITKEEALKEIDKCFEFEFQTINGEPNLVLQFYSAGDLY